LSGAVAFIRRGLNRSARRRRRSVSGDIGARPSACPAESFNRVTVAPPPRAPAVRD
jgi:hypothetical protein